MTKSPNGVYIGRHRVSIYQRIISIDGTMGELTFVSMDENAPIYRAMGATEYEYVARFIIGDTVLYKKVIALGPSEDIFAITYYYETLYSFTKLTLTVYKGSDPYPDLSFEDE